MVYITGGEVINQSKLLLFCLTGSQKKKKKAYIICDVLCVCVCVTLCVLDREGSRVFGKEL